MNVCPSEADLHRYHAGELEASEAERVRRHLAECASCARRDAEIVAANEARVHQLQQLRPKETDAGLPDGVADTVPADVLASTKTADDERPAEPRIEIEGYEIVREIHRGGQGIVYQAIQKSTHRKVAIKVLLEGPYSSKSAKQRFEREIELVASLRHPNIIGIFHSGRTHDGRQFCVMDYVRGVPLDRYVHEENLTLEEALKLFSTVCGAVNYAHQRGVIHRDLKPSNIIVDSAGVPKVLDFGLAKMVGGPEGSLVSVTGQVVGTLPYMSPEQAEGNPDKIDIRTDVYALGVILYQLLTGHYPYPVVGQMADVLKHIAETPPTPPSRSWKSDSGVTRRTHKRLRPGQCPIDDEVQTIVLRTLAKERERRYQSAGELAKDVAHYLADEPIEAKRDSAFYVIRKQLRRYRLPVAVAAAFVLVLSGATVALSIMYQNQSRARQEAVVARNKAETARQAEAQQRHVAEVKTTEAVAARKQADERAESLRRAMYTMSIVQAQAAYEANNIGRMKQLLDQCPADLRGWEWHRLTYMSSYSCIRTLHGHEEAVRAVAFSPDGRRIVSGSDDKTLKVWDAVTGAELLTLRGHQNSVSSVAFSPDGRRIVSGSGGFGSGKGDKTVKVWDAATGDELLSLREQEGSVWSVAFSPDGKRIVSGSADNTLKIWDASAGDELMTLRGHQDRVSSAAFSPDGGRIVSGSWDKTVKVWDAATGDELLSLREQEGPVWSVAFSPDGTRIVSVGISSVKIWDAVTGDALLTLREQVGFVSSVAFSPDGRRLVSGDDMDSTVKVWDAGTGDKLLTLAGHEQPIASVAFSPDGRRIVSGSGDKTVKVWDAVPQQSTLTLREHGAMFLSVAFSPDGNRIAAAGGQSIGSRVEVGMLKVWDAATGENMLTLRGDFEPAFPVAFSPDGKQIVCGAIDKTLKVWDAATGKNTLALRGHQDRVSSVAFSPDGRRIVSGSDDKTLKVWDAATGAELLTLRGHENSVSSVAFSPDGRRIVSGSGGFGSGKGDNTVRVWDAATGDELMTLDGHEERVASVAFSPDGRRIVSGGWDTTLKIWDAATGDELMTLDGHEERVVSVAFSPDGRRIVSSSMSSVKIWDAVTGDELLSLRGLGMGAFAVAFSPDGRRIVSRGADKTLKVWDADTGDELLSLREQEGSVWFVAFSPDGERIVSIIFDLAQAVTAPQCILRVWETKAPPPDVLEARRAVMAEQRRIGSLHDRFRESSKLGDAALKDGKTKVAHEHFAKMLTAAENLAAADPDDPIHRYRLAEACNRLARLADRQGNDDEVRQWTRKRTEARRAFAELAPAGALNSAAYALLTVEPTDLRDPQAALEFAVKANDQTGHKDPSYLNTLALAYHRTGDTARAIEIEEKAVALLPPGDSPTRKSMEASLEKFRQAAAAKTAASRPATTQPAPRAASQPAPATRPDM